MYFEGQQLWKPNARVFALHRNGYAGMQRYAAFLWSGDVQSMWETLRNHVPVAINCGLSGIPYWGTDIGGFIPTPDYTGELHVRWFQFGAFNTLFRAHGRDWHLRLPWGWNTAEPGPVETNYAPPPEQLHNADVEPICRKFLELRYRLMPYLYTAVRDGHDTGLPVVRALWLHDPSDRAGAARGDQYLWGRDVLVAPVVEKGATSRKLYGTRRGKWIRFLDRGRDRGRPRDRPGRHARHAAALRESRRDHPDGASEAVRSSSRATSRSRSPCIQAPTAPRRSMKMTGHHSTSGRAPTCESR